MSRVIFIQRNGLLDKKLLKLYENVLNEKRVLVIAHKAKLASHIRKISNLKITAGSLTIDSILNGNIIKYQPI